MPKSFSTSRPEKVAKFDHSSILVSYNIVAVEATDTRDAGFEFDTVIVPELTKPALVEALVRSQFSVSDELGLLRQRNSKKAEFNAYNDFVEAAKATADAILAE